MRDLMRTSDHFLLPLSQDKISSNLLLFEGGQWMFTLRCPRSGGSVHQHFSPSQVVEVDAVVGYVQTYKNDMITSCPL